MTQDFGNLYHFLDDKVGYGDYLKSDSQKFQYAKIKYYKIEWDSFDGVASKEEFDKYVTDKRIDYENMKINTLVKQCNEFEHEQISFYQVKDQSFAKFLFTIYKERNSNCQFCQKRMSNHIHLFVRSKCYIKMSISSRKNPNLIQQIKENNQQTCVNSERNIQSISYQKFQSQNIQTQSSNQSIKNNKEQVQVKSQVSNEQQLIYDKNLLKINQIQQMEFAKTSTLQPVFQYIQCEQCNQNLTSTQEQIIGKTLSEYSFNRFLQHLFQEHSDQYKKESRKNLKQILEVSDVRLRQQSEVVNKCNHLIRSRIFQIQNLEIKFQIGLTHLYSINRISFIPESVQKNIKECDIKYYKEALQNFKTIFKVIVSDAKLCFSKLSDVVLQKKLSNQQALINIVEQYKSIIDSMESEKDHIFSSIDVHQISNYSNLMNLYVLEQRVNIRLNKLNQLQKEIKKKKLILFEKEDNVNLDLDSSLLLEEEFSDQKEQLNQYYLSYSIYNNYQNRNDKVNKFKEYSTPLNVKEEKDDQQMQPFVILVQINTIQQINSELKQDYIPVYQKNQLSMIAWALNTKQYCRYMEDSGKYLVQNKYLSLQNQRLFLLKTTGIYGQKVSRNYLVEILKKKFIDPSLDEKQRVDEYKMIIKLIKSSENEILVKYENFFKDIMQDKEENELTKTQLGSTTKISYLDLNSQQNTQIIQSNLTQSNHGSRENKLLLDDLKIQSPTKTSQIPRTFEAGIQQVQSKNDLEAENQTSDKVQQKQNDQSQKQRKYSSSQNNLDEAEPKIQIKQSRSSNQIKDNNLTNTPSSNFNELDFKAERNSQTNIQLLNPNINQSKLINHTRISISNSPYKNEQSNNTQSASIWNNNTNISLQTQNDNIPVAINKFSFRGRDSSISTYNIVNSAEKLGEIHILFAKQFEALRNIHGISLERIIQSLRTCSIVKLPGGKTQSVFVKSHDELFIVKEVSQLEFNYFIGFALQYFDYVSQNLNSLLSKIFGLFLIYNEGEKIRYYAVMENLFYGIEKEKCQSYDLKGSKKRRFLKGTDIGLDINLMIDRNCEPFFLDKSSYQWFDKTIRSDSDFLAQQEIVDYSLLLIVDKNNKLLRFGIIDYFRKFDLPKYLEMQFKGLIFGEDPTIIKPKEYQERFVKTLTKSFFCKV